MACPQGPCLARRCVGLQLLVLLATEASGLSSSRFTQPAPPFLARRIPLAGSAMRRPAVAVERRCCASMAARASASERRLGMLELLEYLWPRRGGYRHKARVVAALLLLLIAKLYVVRVPFVFKAAVDALSAPAGSKALGAAGYMLVYGLSRAVYTLLQVAARRTAPRTAATAPLRSHHTQRGTPSRSDHDTASELPRFAKEARQPSWRRRQPPSARRKASPKMHSPGRELTRRATVASELEHARRTFDSLARVTAAAHPSAHRRGATWCSRRWGRVRSAVSCVTPLATCRRSTRDG